MTDDVDGNKEVWEKKEGGDEEEEEEKKELTYSIDIYKQAMFFVWKRSIVYDLLKYKIKLLSFYTPIEFIYILEKVSCLLIISKIYPFSISYRSWRERDFYSSD